MSARMYTILFKLTGGHVVQVTLHENAARGYLKDWLAGKMPEVVGEYDANGPWGVRTSEIVSVQLFDTEEMIKAQQAAGTRPQQPMLGGGSWLGRSGNN